jgi:nicotinamide-nucleotide amidase
MSNDVNAEIIAIGTEILLGEITDTNSVFIARALRDIGVNLFFMTSVGDNEDRIESSIRIALSRAQVVITCGGLGPTVDDMTRQGVARATERGLTFHQHLLDAIAQRFNGFKMQMTENNRRQAYVPDDALIIENPVGTAPAFAVEVGDKVVISLPGVPREMKYLFTERVIPYLREKYQLGGKIIKARVLKTAGIGESMLDDAIGKELLEASNPTVGLAAHSGQVDVRITAKADTEAEADAMIADFDAKLRARIGRYIFGADEATIDRALVDTLLTHNATLLTMETGIEPIIGARLNALQPGIASGGTFSSLAALAEAYGLNEDLPIRQLAEQTLQAACERAGITAGLAVASHSGTDDRADQDELSAVAVYVNGKVRSRTYGFGGNTDVAKQFTSTWAMAMVWRMMVDGGE